MCYKFLRRKINYILALWGMASGARELSAIRVSILLKEQGLGRFFSEPTVAELS